MTIATYVYFIGCLFSRQFLDPEQGYEHFYVDFYFPVFTFLQVCSMSLIVLAKCEMLADLSRVETESRLVLVLFLRGVAEGGRVTHQSMGRR